MQVGDLVSVYQYAHWGIGIVIKTDHSNGKVMFSDGEEVWLLLRDLRLI